MKSSEIKFTVSLDENKIPTTIQWEAADSGVQGLHDAKAAMLTVWDGKTKTSLRIDLWTKDMLIDEMKQFFYESMMTMSETYDKATNDARMAGKIKRFAELFARESGLLSGEPVEQLESKV
jgi:gliding motility-associated protein GldC